MMDVLIAIFCAIPVIGFVFWIDCKYGKKQPVVKINGATVTLPPLESMRVGDSFNIENNTGCDVTVARHPHDTFVLKAGDAYPRMLPDLNIPDDIKHETQDSNGKPTGFAEAIKQHERALTMADLTRKADALIKRKRKRTK